MKKTSFKLMLATVCVLLASAFMNQTNAQQKAWSGNNNGFGIDSLNNPSTVTWDLTQGPGTGLSANAVGGGKGVRTTTLWYNTTSNAIKYDTIQAFETMNGCVSSVVKKGVNVYPLPTLSVGPSETICYGEAMGTRTLTISNFATIGGAANMGNFNINMDLRVGSATGPSVPGASALLTFSNVSTNTVSLTVPSGALPAGSYFLVVTGFSSTTTASGTAGTAGYLPAPGSIASGNSAATVTALPTNGINYYTVVVRPQVVTSPILSY